MQLDQTGRLKRLFAGRKGFVPGDHRRARRVRRPFLRSPVLEVSVC